MLIRRATVDDAPAIARAHVRSWGETYRGIVPDAYIDALDPARREAFWRQELGKGHFALVAEKEGAVAGFADGGPFRGEPVGIPGELYAMYLLAAHHRKGIGTRLLKGVRTHLSGLGLMPFGARVLAKIPPAGSMRRWVVVSIPRVSRRLAAFGVRRGSMSLGKVQSATVSQSSPA